MRVASLIAAFLATANVLGSEPLKMISTLPPESPQAAPFNQFISSLFQRSHLAYTITYLPSKRAGMAFTQGQFDGDVARTDFMAQLYPAAIRVLPSYISNPYFAISRDLNIKNWKALEGLRIAYLRGNLLVENQLGSKAILNPIDQIDSCIKMVKAERVDVCILHGGARPTAEFTEAKPALRIDQFDSVSIYIWLAPQHRAQAVQLGKTLSEMQKDGSLAAFQATILNPASPRPQ